MNVSATSSSLVGSTSSNSSSNSSSTKNTDTSFKAEMDSAAKTEETSAVNETKTSNADEKKSEKSFDKQDKKSENFSQDTTQNDNIVPSGILNGEINFSDFKYHNETQSILSQNIQSLLNTKDLITAVNSAQSFDYDVINMSENDANFFANLVQKTDMSMNNIASQISEMADTEGLQQNIQVSSVLMEKLAKSMKTNQSFRIDFDKDVSVIIKVNRDGSLSANFIPGDKAVEQYLKNNIGFLKQRFDEQELSYSELSYSNSREEQKQRRQNKENNNER